jgi:hypothetical protein
MCAAYCPLIDSVIARRVSSLWYENFYVLTLNLVHGVWGLGMAGLSARNLVHGVKG